MELVLIPMGMAVAFAITIGVIVWLQDRREKKARASR